ncbi:hypothetical protein [Devosia sp. RR2S18]|uniref:hypothetical protein n=1 Tax=Devosia rhizosphaerae TaxID=3049774 RepID=UPI0025425E3F|nr:hypothetical protein [Devosia sp. RR2S18]WIJ24151.1 hypothetical protein QOV41_14155 [Devosia sp. RR2S18]
MKRFTDTRAKELAGERKRIAVGAFADGTGLVDTLEALQQHGVKNYTLYTAEAGAIRPFVDWPQPSSVLSLSRLLPEAAFEQVQALGPGVVLLGVDLESSEAEQAVATILLQSAAAAVQIHDRLG